MPYAFNCFVVQMALYLKDSWISTLRAGVRTSLRDVGRGWFNLHESDWEVYEVSKLKKFIEMIKFNMQVLKHDQSINQKAICIA